MERHPTELIHPHLVNEVHFYFREKLFVRSCEPKNILTLEDKIIEQGRPSSQRQGLSRRRENTDSSDSIGQGLR